MQLAFSILSWGAWSPEYQQQQDWQQWQSSNCALDDSDRIAPKLPQVAAMQRRRFSRLSKMMLEAAFQAEAPSQCRSVFASRHGELNRTIELLQDIIARQPLSPMGFSQSVHNTASGLFGIVTGNTGASTSVAAGTDTLSQAMLEAWAQLAEDPSPLLLVFGDDPVPPVYDEFTQEMELPLALSLQLAPADVTGIARVTLSQQTGAGQPLSFGALLQALANGTAIHGQLAYWHWQLEPSREPL
ncbi:3-oxoacyl-ACP synthase [Shewanella algae]|uniref:beta-ketoacyl synthase chain length factor n=1 Tax=Shewanella algae TaxID=38313 RepID=UPI0011B6B482|nr:beta-ketoacyl synthase chain length factor [Shewanella algae]TWU61566.1 3-oxoacyl-ACP synthase [Shewanella algae]